MIKRNMLLPFVCVIAVSFHSFGAVVVREQGNKNQNFISVQSVNQKITFLKCPSSDGASCVPIGKVNGYSEEQINKLYSQNILARNVNAVVGPVLTVGMSAAVIMVAGVMGIGTAAGGAGILGYALVAEGAVITVGLGHAFYQSARQAHQFANTLKVSKDGKNAEVLVPSLAHYISHLEANLTYMNEVEKSLTVSSKP